MVLFPEAAVICIGPAGENLVRHACVISDLGRAHGRTGIGAVMGSKNLKAVTVRGTKGVTVAQNDLLLKAAKELIRDRRADFKRYNGWARYGTSAQQKNNNRLGTLPCKNYTEGVWDKGDALYGQYIMENNYLALSENAGYNSVRVNPGHAGIRKEVKP